MGQAYGYIRVSTKDQNEDRQVQALRALSIEKERIYMDKQSGKDFKRPKYQALLKKLRKDDILYITSIDRLGRNYEEILEEWRRLTRTKQVDICVLDMPLLDTRRGKDLLGTFLGDVVLQVLSFVAEHERDSIRKRQAEGIAAAKKRGVRFGRPRRPLPAAFEKACALWQEGKLTAAAAAKICGMPRSTFCYYAKERKEARKKVASITKRCTFLSQERL